VPVDIALEIGSSQIFGERVELGKRPKGQSRTGQEADARGQRDKFPEIVWRRHGGNPREEGF
jgi:hypothetical protein